MNAVGALNMTGAITYPIMTSAKEMFGSKGYKGTETIYSEPLAVGSSGGTYGSPKNGTSSYNPFEAKETNWVTEESLQSWKQSIEHEMKILIKDLGNKITEEIQEKKVHWDSGIDKILIPHQSSCHREIITMMIKITERLEISEKYFEGKLEQEEIDKGIFEDIKQTFNNPAS